MTTNSIMRLSTNRVKFSLLSYVGTLSMLTKGTDEMMYVISGAVITRNDGRRFSYFEKCDSCGWVNKNIVHNQPVITGNSEAHRGILECRECGLRTAVVIGSTKDPAADNGYGSNNALRTNTDHSVGAGWTAERSPGCTVPLLLLVVGLLALGWVTFQPGNRQSVVRPESSNQTSVADRQGEPIAEQDQPESGPTELPAVDEVEEGPSLTATDTIVDPGNSDEVKAAIQKAFTEAKAVLWKANGDQGYAVPSEEANSVGCRSIYYTSEKLGADWRSPVQTICAPK